MADVRKIIETVVRERLADAGVVDVRIEEDIDSEGDAIFRVMVIFDKNLSDARKTTGLARHTRARLNEAGNSRFPIFRFVSQSDAKRLTAEAA